jgi:RimJ/RimL family protein N-acetyltransferase
MMTKDHDSKPRLETERLTLRPLAAEDAGPMAALADDIGVARMTTAIPHPYERDMADGFIERMSQTDPRREVTFAVQAREGDFMGVLGIHPREGFAAELGYWIGRPYWGQGYMTEAVSAALAWAGGPWGRRALVSGHFADNEASGRVLTKSCFLYTGEVEPRFSLARGEEAETRMMVWLA